MLFRSIGAARRPAQAFVGRCPIDRPLGAISTWPPGLLPCARSWAARRPAPGVVPLTCFTRLSRAGWAISDKEQAPLPRLSGHPRVFHGGCFGVSGTPPSKPSVFRFGVIYVWRCPSGDGWPRFPRRSGPLLTTPGRGLYLGCWSQVRLTR